MVRRIRWLALLHQLSISAIYSQSKWKGEFTATCPPAGLILILSLVNLFQNLAKLDSNNQPISSFLTLKQFIYAKYRERCIMVRKKINVMEGMQNGEIGYYYNV